MLTEVRKGGERHERGRQGSRSHQVRANEVVCVMNVVVVRCFDVIDRVNPIPFFFSLSLFLCVDGVDLYKVFLRE